MRSILLHTVTLTDGEHCLAQLLSFRFSCGRLDGAHSSCYGRICFYPVQCCNDFVGLIFHCHKSCSQLIRNRSAIMTFPKAPLVPRPAVPQPMIQFHLVGLRVLVSTGVFHTANGAVAIPWKRSVPITLSVCSAPY